MRAWKIACLAGAALVASACTARQAPAAPPAEPRAAHDGRLRPPERVAERVWVMRQPDRLWAAVIGNVVIVEQDDGVVLVDSGGSIADGRDIVAAVARLTSKPIAAVALTHWHNDHPLGLPAILAAFPRARVLATPATARFIASETKVAMGKSDPAADARRRAIAAQTIAEFEAEAANPANPAELRAEFATEAQWVAQRVERQMGNYAVAPTETFTDSLLLDDAVAPVELRFLGAANTGGDIIAWLPRQRVVAVGDMVVLPTPYGFTVSTRPWLATLARLEALPFTVLIPGHGKIQRERTYLATLAWSMRDLAAHAKAAAAAGHSKEQALAAFDRAEQQRRFAAADPWTRHWLDGYWLDGMFATAFDEAKGIPAPGK